MEGFTHILFAFIIAIIWGLTPIVYKSIYHEVSYQCILFISAIIYFFFVMAYTYVYEYTKVKKDLLLLSSKHIFTISITSFVGIFLANLLYYKAIEQTHNLNIVILITALYPMITLIFAYFILGETLSTQSLIGYAFILTGMSMILLHHNTKQ